jgi:hypothetical protein
VASTDPDFRTYATLDDENFIFLKNIYYQLGRLWGRHRSKAQEALMGKLWSAIAIAETRR